MEVLIYAVLASVTFAAVYLAAGDDEINVPDRVAVAFGLAGVWPIVWVLFIPVICTLIATREPAADAETVPAE